MAEKILLLDGWFLAAEPNGPAALHLYALLNDLPPAARTILVIPVAAPAWLQAGPFETILRPTRLNPAGHLAWTQLKLPGLVRQTQADFLFITGETAPLSSPAQLVVCPAGYNLVRAAGTRGTYRGPLDHLGASLGWTGLSRAPIILWPSDLPAPDNLAGQRKMAPFVHPAFKPERNDKPILLPELPDTYVLYHGPRDPETLRKLLEAWGWASGSIGEYFPLVLAGVPQAELPVIQAQLAKSKQAQTIRLLPELPPTELAALFQNCTVFLYPAAFSPWGDSVRHALACGKPVVATNNPLAERLVGTAAFLTPVQDSRALGAALISVVVEEALAEKLAQAACQRSVDWLKTTPAQSLASGLPELD